MRKIVVIEEDVAMRTLFCEWLTAQGYRVQTRSSVLQPDVDVVIVNLSNLPSQGAETVGQVKQLYPNAAVVATSTQLSRSLPRDSGQARSLGVVRLVPKPCSRNELLYAVADALGTVR
ncbi:MAG: response regulator receiver [Rhizobacter sp.]|nr:response regulator receiver [Rhizobacter sp.]